MSPSESSLHNPVPAVNHVPETPVKYSLLSDQSPGDKPWDTHAFEKIQITEWMQGGDDWQQKKAENMKMCAYSLIFSVEDEGLHKLKKALFCRVRLCPVCLWRKSLAWKARWYAAEPILKTLHTNRIRYIFMTLSLPNVPVEELGATLKKMNKAWKRMIDRNTWPALGYARSTEITIEGEGKSKRKGYVNPHFHVLLAVRHSYFKKHYMSADAWRRYWASALEMSPAEMTKPHISAIPEESGVDGVAASVREVFKYAVKFDSYKKIKAVDGHYVKTFLELDRQIKGTRSTDLGGIIKTAFKGEDEISEEEMLAAQSLETEAEALEFREYLLEFDRRRYSFNRLLDADEMAMLKQKEAKLIEKKAGLKRELPEPIRVSEEQKVDWKINRACLESEAKDVKTSRKPRKLKLDRQRDGEL